MYKIPDTIKGRISEPHIIGLFLIGDTEPLLTSLDDLISCSYDAPFCGGGLTIGALCSAHVTISSYGQHDLAGRDIAVKLGFGDAPEWLQLGAFRVCECHVGDDTTSITAYDAAYWATGGVYSPTVQTPTSVRAVLEDVCEQCNITLGSLPATADRVIDGRLTGYTARQIIMHMASACGCNAVVDRSGALRLKWLSDNGQAIGPDDYYADELTNATTINIVGIQMKTKITTPSTDPDTGITVEHEEEKTYSSASGTGRVLAVDCPYANQELVDAVAHSMIPLSYAVGNVSFIGGYDVEPGDMLMVTSLNGAVHSVPVLGLTLSLDGGCRATVKAEGYSDTDTSANFDTEYQQALSRLEASIIAVKNLTADNIEAQSAYIKRLSSDEAFINQIFAQNINATGTITGAKLVGTEISGESMYVGCKSRSEFPSVAGISVDFQYGGIKPPGGAPPNIPAVTIGTGSTSSAYTTYLDIQGNAITTHTHDDELGSVSVSITPWGGLVVDGEIYSGRELVQIRGDAKVSGTISAGTNLFGSNDAIGLGWQINTSATNGIGFYRYENGEWAASIWRSGVDGKNRFYGDATGNLPLTGGTITGPLNVSYSAAGERTEIVVSEPGGPSLYVGVGSSKINHGIYSNTLGGWLICGNAANVTMPLVYSKTTTGGANMIVSSDGAVRRTTSSSRRYKTAIEGLPLDMVRGLYALPVHTYLYKDGYISVDDERYGRKIPGLIAEELEAILPIAVDHRDGKAEMWNSNILVPCLLRLVQDLNERVEMLEKRLEALKRKEDCK